MNLSSWVDYFDSLQSSEIINKSKIEHLMKLFNSTHTDTSVRASMEKHPETVFIAKLSIGNRLNLFHHFKRSGGTVYNTTKTDGVIIGTKKEPVAVVTPDTEILFAKPTYPVVNGNVPTRTHLYDATTPDEIDNLTLGSEKIKCRNFTPVPPFLIRPIARVIQETKGDIKAIMLAAMEETFAFDVDHEDETDYPVRAVSACHAFIQWLYLADQDLQFVAQIPIEICDDIDLLDEMKKTKDDCLGSPISTTNSASFALQAPLARLAASSLSTQNAVNALLQSTAAGTDKSAKSFSKLPPQYAHMLLVAEAVSDVMGTELHSLGMEFFAQSNEKKAMIYINAYLESNQIRVSCQPAVANLLHHGSFLWTNSSTPSGFAMSVLTYETIHRQDILTEALAIDLSTRHEMTPSTVAKLTKTHITFATTAEELIEKLKAFLMLAKLFWSETSKLPQALTLVTNWFIDNRMLVETRAASDSQFYAKVTSCVDERVYLWLKSCMKAENGKGTLDDLINFQSLISDIQLNRFMFNLPASVTVVRPRRIDNDDDGREVPKRQRQGAKRVDNNDAHPSWIMRANESYDTVFAHKVKQGPTLSFNAKGCHKYHNKGYCWDDCQNAASHKKLSGTDFTKFGNYIKQCRGEL